MPDPDTRFRIYLKAFFSDILTRMSGPLSVPFAGLAIWVSNRSQKILWGCLAVVCAVFASYRVWRKERRDANTLLETVRAAKDAEIATLTAEKDAEIDAQTRELQGERERTQQPDVVLVWGWSEDKQRNRELLGLTEKEILIHNRSNVYIYNVSIDPIPAAIPLCFDVVPNIAPGDQPAAVGRWESPAQGNTSSVSTNYAYYFAAIEQEATERGWYQRKPHNRGLGNAWFKIPMTVRYQAHGIEWMTEFEFTHDIGEDSYFSRITGRRV